MSIRTSDERQLNTTQNGIEVEVGNVESLLQFLLVDVDR